MKKLHVKLTLTEEMLGMMPNDKEIHATYIASKAPDAPSREEEIAAVGVDEMIEKGTTVFPRMDENGLPFYWDYQLKGFFKDAVSMLRRDKASKCSKVTAYKKIIDGNLFVRPLGEKYVRNEKGAMVRNRRIPIELYGGESPETAIGTCQRPLRAQTAQGERVALSSSETVPAGSTIEFIVEMMTDDMMPWVKECLDYGEDRGLGQWRNSGKGTFIWTEIG